MKKVLTIILVLSLASMASATISISYHPENNSLSISSDEDNEGLFFFVLLADTPKLEFTGSLEGWPTDFGGRWLGPDSAGELYGTDYTFRSFFGASWLPSGWDGIWGFISGSVPAGEWFDLIGVDVKQSPFTVNMYEIDLMGNLIGSWDSPLASFGGSVPVPPASLAENPSMEGPFIQQDPLGYVSEHWTGWRNEEGYFSEGSYAHYGSKSQEIYWNGWGYEPFGPGGIYQQIGSLQAGESYRASFWFKLRFAVEGESPGPGGWTDSSGEITYSIGIDPNGGTDPELVANWSNLSEVGYVDDGPWLNVTTFFSPNGSTATVFIRVHGWADAMQFWEEPECPEPPCDPQGGPAHWDLYCYIDDVVVELAQIGQDSTVEATSPVPANGASYSEVTITAVDSNGNPIEKIPASEIVVDCTGSGNTITGPDAPTDENGQTTARITSTVAETKTVSVTVLGSLLSDTATVEFGEGYFGPEWHVDASNMGYGNGSPEQPFTSISEAIIPAQDGETLIVYPSTYIENIDFLGKAITIRSTDPNDLQLVQSTIIDGSSSGSVVSFKSGEGINSVLSGFTITGGSGTEGYLDTLGGGIYCKGSPTITNNIITNNTADKGGGIYCYNPYSWEPPVTPSIRNNVITDNSASDAGGGIYQCSGEVINCLIINNTKYSSLGGLWVGGGGLYGCDGNIVNCTIVNNSSATYPSRGGMYRCNGTITNCIIWNNGSSQLHSCSTPTYSCVEGGCSGEGCIGSDPRFVDAANGDYHLLPWSPCIDAGRNDPPAGLPATDIEGTARPVDGDKDGIAIADMGAYESLLYPELHINWHRPIGSVIGPIEHIDVKFDEPIDSATFTEEDIVITRPDGTNVPLTGQLVHQGSNIWRVYFPPQSLVGKYELQVGPQIEDLDGNQMDQNLDHIPGEIPEDHYVGTFFIKGAKIIEHSPVGSNRGQVNSIRLFFYHPMDANTFSPSEDVVSFAGPEGSILITDARWIDPCVLEVTFDVQYIAGEYEMLVGPHILNVAGNPMDQDYDGVAGEFPDDCYEASFELTYWSGRIGDTHWRFSPIIVDGPLIVDYEDGLVIDPGVVVKFLNSSANIDVQGGFLEARGTVDKPIILTSFKDDSAGGDINGDANSTVPNPGDWYGIDFSRACTPTGTPLYGPSRAHLENVEIRYATKAIDADYEDADVQLKNVKLVEGEFGVYVYQPYSEVKAENCLIERNAKTGIFVRADSRHVFRNCTIVGNGFDGSGWYGAGVHLGGADLTLDNCIVAFNSNGLHHGGDPPALTVRHCDFYNPEGQEIVWNCCGDQPVIFDQNGNTTKDPNFVDYSTGNYELADGSPAIDTGRGIHAPYQDILGRNRYDDRGIFNIGTGYPCYIDMGAFERQQDTTAGDLAVTFVSAPEPEFVSNGDSFTVEWTVANIGTLDCNTPWQDVVYLSDDPYFSSDDFVLERRDHNDPLIPGASYTETLTTTVPAVSGPQYVLVRTDANDSLLEAAQANNEGASLGVMAVDVPLLEIATPQADTAPQGEWKYYRFEGQPGRTVRFTLDSAVGSWQLYLRRALPPTMSAYDVAGDQEMRLLEPIEGTYYIGVYAQWLPEGPTSYTLSAELTELDIRQVSPEVVGNAGHATFKVEGDNFDPNAQVQLIGPSGTINGEEWYQDTTVVFATFDLDGAGATPGLYDVVVTNPGPESVTAYGVVTIGDGGAAQFTANLVVPGLARPGRTIELRFEYTNVGDVDLPSPLVRLQAGAEDYQWQLPDWDHWVIGRDFHILALSSEGPAGILRPHQAESLVVRLQIPFRPHDVMLSLDVLSSSDTRWGDTVDWEAIMGEPDSSISNPEEWQAFWTEFSTRLGQTWGSIVTNLGSQANELSSYDFSECSVQALLDSFAMESMYALPMDEASSTSEVFSPLVNPMGVGAEWSWWPQYPRAKVKCVNHDKPETERDNVLVIHGLGMSPDSEYVKYMIDRLKWLDNQGSIDVDILVVDWRELATDYLMALHGRKIVAEDIDKYLQQNNLLGLNTTIIEGSFGDPITHQLCQRRREEGLSRPRRIWGLDPPYLVGRNTDRLDSEKTIHVRCSILGIKGESGHVNILLQTADLELRQIKRHKEVWYTMADLFRDWPGLITTSAMQDELPIHEWQVYDAFGNRIDMRPEDLRELLRENDSDIWWSDDWILPEVPLEEYLQTKVSVMTSFTPEDKFGPAGYDTPGTPEGSEVRYIPAEQTLNYRIEFWNKEDALVPTQDAIIEDVLDPDTFDLSTFEFTRFGFLKWDLPLPGGQVIDTRIDCRPEMDIAVEVTSNFDPESGKIDWWFHCVDPMTGDYPEDPMAGFLPPYNPETGYEIGWVEFRVKLKAGLPSGTQITNQAFVEFDFAGDLYDHPAPKEDPWINTIDAWAPSSYVLPLPATPPEPNFVMEWTGQDDIGGSGIAHYDIFVASDGGEYVLWLDDTIETSSLFEGEDGHSYAFYSVSYDNVGNIEELPLEPDAIVVFNRPPIANAGFDQAIVCGYNTERGTKVTLDGTNSSDPDGDPLTYTWMGPFDESPAQGSTPTVTLSPGCPGDYLITLVVNDGMLDSNPDEVTVTVQDPVAAVTYDGDTLVSTGGSSAVAVQIIATLRDASGSVLDVDGARVNFTLTAEGIEPTIVETALSENGIAQSTLSLQPAIYKVEMTLDCSDIVSTAILVVYNPEGGFATGGGWIIPEVDGLNTHPNVRANFGFNAKYKKGDPTGHLEFRYSDGYIDLKSSSIEKLVITGGKIVQFKGWASVNGEDGYWFFVKAIDNGEPGTSDVFDIKIWAPGVSPEGDSSERAGGVLQGGNILVHTKSK